MATQALPKRQSKVSGRSLGTRDLPVEVVVQLGDSNTLDPISTKAAKDAVANVWFRPGADILPDASGSPRQQLIGQKNSSGKSKPAVGFG